MDGYKNFIPLTISFAPHLAYQMGFQNIQNLAKNKGIKVDRYCNAGVDVYELNIEHYGECAILTERLKNSIVGARHLPEIMLIGLVSVYDAMLGRLLKVVFSRHEEIILTSEKSIKFSDLLSYDSIDTARSVLIDKEIESILRESHHDQFACMESKFKIKLRESLPIWPTFVEVCERRNLLTHTGGRVSVQYIASGRENGFDVSSIVVGQQLEVDLEYYSRALNAVYEVGAKLCHVLWRKFAEKERKQADEQLNYMGFSLVRERSYKLAEAILKFGAQFPKHSDDKIKRMMIVNWANAVRLDDRPAEAEAILQREDWSAVADDFKISVAAVRQDVEEVVRLMNAIGPSGEMKADYYRNWPVFRGLRTNEKFADAFEQLFGSRLLVPKKTAIVDEPSTVKNDKTAEDEVDIEKTLH